MGTYANSNIPLQIDSLTGIIAIAAGGALTNSHSLAVKSDKSVWAWGKNGYGQFGSGTSGDSSNVPVQSGFNFLSCNTSAIEEFTEGISEVTVYPNPSSDGKFWVSIPSEQVTGYKLQVISVEIYNSQGEKIYHSINPPIRQSIIDLSSESDGIYFMLLNTGGRTVSKKIVLMK